MRLLGVIAVCIGLAVVLVAVLSNHNSAVQPEPAKVPEPEVVISNSIRQFEWHQIETEDYRQYVSNLRQIGCPEATLEDIIVADVNSAYLNHVRPVVEEFRLATRTSRGVARSDWTALSQARWSLDHRLEATNLLRVALITNLLGRAAEVSKIATAPWDYLLKSLTMDDPSYLEEGKRKVVEEMRKEARAEAQSIVAAAGGMTPKALREIDAVKNRLYQRLASVLTADETREFWQRHSEVSRRVTGALEGMTLKAGDSDAVLGAWEAFSAKYGEFATVMDTEPEDPALRAAYVADKARLREEINSILGADLYSEYMRNSDPEFQQLQEFVSTAGLDKASANQLYQVKKSTVEAVAMLNQDSSLSTDVKNAKISELVAGSKESIAKVLSNENQARYINSKSGSWLRSIEAVGSTVQPGKPGVWIYKPGQ